MAEARTRSLLLVDSDADERRMISAIAARSGWSTVSAADDETALALLQGPHGREVQAALLGAWDPEHGPRLIETLRHQRNHLPVIVLSVGDSVSTAVEAMRAGASDFLVRPVAPERLLEALAPMPTAARPRASLRRSRRSSPRCCRSNSWSVLLPISVPRSPWPPRPRATACRS